ncbi:hypothetical protein A3D62_02135 [Candidatus Kaiserbacteria bacterium RIFCSPHIGHO2_02_FULL_49_11]|uniref:Aminotransferase class V domain-containing protein n=1 Tax=Candidatus Kaiserbacteria bacterium RIFCSPHIGHO2_02_FULL_49_11 TaxID=1798489 RepID=A0A1F6D074_9BACT|nr:MAG: hypothetical protein A3D62_02135 [Candidatus Kaiserbacteria bacterium RIFCSPHIGHO2_02_FULL_49_11]
MGIFSKKKRIYLDYAASTPLDSVVLKKMMPYWALHFGNGGGLHEEGRRAKEAIDEARGKIARTLLVQSDEIIFTGSGTEANNLGITGYLEGLKLPFAAMHAVTSSAEHPSVLECFKDFEKRGGEVTYIDLNEQGFVEAKRVYEALMPQTRLVSVGFVNSEIGTLQPIADIAHEILRYEKKSKKGHIAFHTDACQAPLYFDCSPKRLGVDSMSIDAQKIYGPKGVGFLYSKRGINIAPILKGGGQERGIRPGTENVPLIVGMGESFLRAVEGREKESARLTQLRDYFIKKIQKEIPRAILNGDATLRSPSNVNISIPGADNEYVVIALDEQGIAATTKSACLGSRLRAASYVITSLTKDLNRAQSALRFTLGKHTTKKDLEQTVYALVKTVQIIDKFKFK